MDFKQITFWGLIMKRKRLITTIITAALTASIALSGCGNLGPTGTTKVSTNEKQILNIIGYDFNSLDPGKVADAQSFTAMTNVYEGLMKEVVNEKGESHNEFAGAEKVDISEDKLTYTFHLRKDAVWTDGKPVTAKDYVYAWKRIIDPKTAAPYMNLMDDINVKGAKEIIEAVNAKKDKSEIDKLLLDFGVKAKDDYTFVVTLSKPTPYFTNVLCFKSLAPVREDKVKEQGDKFGSDPISTVYNGPFVISEYAKGSKIVYKKNDKYWNAKNVKLEQANGTIVTEPSTLVKLFENKELDVVNASKDDLDKLKEESKKGQYQYVTRKESRACFNYYNVTSSVLKNAKIRLALSLALDRQEFLNVVYKSYLPSNGYIGNGVSCGDKEYRKAVQEPLKNVKDDPKKLFEEGLKEEGIDDASKVSLKLLLGVQTAESKATGDYLAKLYKDKFGINIKQEFTPDAQTYYKDRTDGNFDICNGGWAAAYDDVSTFFTVFRTGDANNDGKYSNKEYDELINKAGIENDNEKRLDLYKKAEEMLIAKDAAVMPTYYTELNQFRQNYVKNFTVPKFGPYYDLSTAYIEGKEK
ncbi:peptide ABC transporter substrate-binding protein [Clostridiaceae bacterium WCA-383-APC-5B]|uniref:Peptide ABC transporter substrate-binding protein n=2 Tax=Inconstantimicrobium porci TaxID=2652291 RepID=A0A7X2MWV3_9CLOT|nr:peptide ABC transporter substrate-binding protein [Inconstantimicrobium porci]